jgi:MFS family permease
MRLPAHARALGGRNRRRADRLRRLRHGVPDRRNKLCQTVATSYVTTIAREGRSSAVGLYVTAFYVGGSMGAFLPGLAWNSTGWPACIAMVIAMLAAMALIAALAYGRPE